MIILNRKVHLKAVHLSDQETIFRLMLEIYPPVYSHLWLDNGEKYLRNLYSRDNLETELQNPNSYYYFIYYQDQLVGILRVLDNDLTMQLTNKSSVKLQRIYLSGTVRGKGIGKRIIRWVEDEFCKEGNRLLWLEVMDSQEAAIGFYEKIGFEKIERFNFNSILMKNEYRGMYRMVKKCNS